MPTICTHAWRSVAFLALALVACAGCSKSTPDDSNPSASTAQGTALPKLTTAKRAMAQAVLTKLRKPDDPHQRLRMVAGALTMIETGRMPAAWVAAMKKASMASMDPNQLDTVVLKELMQGEDEKALYKRVCPDGKLSLEDIEGQARPLEKKVELLFHECKLARYQLLEQKEAPTAGPTFLMAAHMAIERVDQSLHSNEKKLLRELVIASSKLRAKLQAEQQSEEADAGTDAGAAAETDAGPKP